MPKKNFNFTFEIIKNNRHKTNYLFLEHKGIFRIKYWQVKKVITIIQKVFTQKLIYLQKTSFLINLNQIIH